MIEHSQRAGFVLGTRASALAVWQAEMVAQAVRSLGREVHVRRIKTLGDKIGNIPLSKIGDKGLFTQELDDAILTGQIDLAVHSLKDLPTRLPDGIFIAAVTEREEPWDAFISGPRHKNTLEELPDGATLATSSLRRHAQLKAWRADLNVVPIRGNVDTRLKKLDESDWHGIVLAKAGLVRLNLAERVTSTIPPEIMLPAVGQGALAVVCRDGDDETRSTLSVLHHSQTASATAAERALLRRLEGGCQVPIGAWARINNKRVYLDGCIASVDGGAVVRDSESGSIEDAEAIGTALAERLLAGGGAAILNEIRQRVP